MSAIDPTLGGWREGDPRDQREFVTPEGIDLKIRLASAGQRATAFLIDYAILIGVMIAFTLFCVAVSTASKGTKANDVMRQTVVIGWTLGVFVLRNGYFLAFEMGARSATPGKRAMGIRVAARDGGQLGPGAIFARNALREIEVLLPLSFFFVSLSQSAALTGLACLVWSCVCLFLPLMNRDRLRLGDMLAGSWVLQSPRRSLRVDVGQAGERLASAFVFTPEQLAIYGERELQVLEEVIRRNHTATVKEVADRIRRKIDWVRGADERDLDFLDAFYTALRRKLETGMLYGRRRKDKHDNGAVP
jgi:uncharacterized RDD family membrane protein YckC